MHDAQDERRASGGRAKHGKVDKAKQAAVLDAFMHSWTGYKQNAWGQDELCPVSMTGKNTSHFGGMGATLIDSMSSLWMLGLTEDFDQYARQA